MRQAIRPLQRFLNGLIRLLLDFMRDDYLSWEILTGTLGLMNETDVGFGMDRSLISARTHHRRNEKVEEIQ